MSTVRRRYHIHLPGLVYLGLVLLVGVAAANRPNNLLVWVFAAMLAGVLLSGVISGFMLRKVSITRTVPRTARVGEALMVRYVVRNESRAWPVFALFIRELPEGDGANWSMRASGARAFVQHVAPRETVTAETVFVPVRRGRLCFRRMRGESIFPFGLVLKSIRYSQPSDTLVLPRTVRLKPGTLAVLAAGGLAGSSTSRRAGPGGDFLGIREYRPGDSLRHIAWRRSASTGNLTVVERSVDVPPRVHVVLDLRRPTQALRVDPAGPSARALEEMAIALTASLLVQADAERYELRLSILGLPGARIPMRRGHWHLQKMLAMLGGLDLDAPRHGTDAPIDQRERGVMLVVHVDRTDLGVGDTGTVHLAATQFAGLAQNPAEVEALAAEAQEPHPTRRSWKGMRT